MASLFGMPPRQARMSPPMVAKMKLAAVPPAGMTKLPAPAPATPPVGLGTFANVAVFGVPAALMIVDVLERWLTGHQGEPALAARPHGLISRASCRSAGISVVFDDARLCVTY